MKYERWLIPETDDAAVEALMDAGYPYLVSTVLASRGVVTPEQAAAHLDRERSLVYSPFLMRDMDKAVTRIDRALAGGETQIVNAARLRLKESDRLESTAAMLRALGAQVTVRADGLTVCGRPALTGGTVDPQHDHSPLVILDVVTSCGCTAPVTVQDRACTDKSYPRFWADLAALTAVSAAETTKPDEGA